MVGTHETAGFFLRGLYGCIRCYGLFDCGYAGALIHGLEGSSVLDRLEREAADGAP